jgi:HEPN domain-containing protein
LSPSPEQVEYAELLLRRAKDDLQACRVLADDTDIDDNIVGFHAQQAVEKALKVALVLQMLIFRSVTTSQGRLG